MPPVPCQASAGASLRPKNPGELSDYPNMRYWDLGGGALDRESRPMGLSVALTVQQLQQGTGPLWFSLLLNAAGNTSTFREPAHDDLHELINSDPNHRASVS